MSFNSSVLHLLPARLAHAGQAHKKRATDGLPSKKTSMKARPGDPMFREVWRKFQLRVHPDLFMQYPELQATNAGSLKKLQGILNEAKSSERQREEMLKARIEQLEFFVRLPEAPAAAANSSSGPAAAAPAAPAFLRVPLTIRIPGSNCQHVLGDALSTLFAHCGLPTRFHWGPEYWGSTYTASSKEGSEEEA